MSLPAPAETFDAAMTDGTTIRCRRHAIGKGPCLAITHGNGFATDGYRVFWEPLLERFEVVLFDMRNHGQNAPSIPDRHNYLQMSLDLASVERAIRPRLAAGQKLVAVTHSMSGRAVMKQVVEQGWSWDAIVLFDPPNVPPRGHALFETMRTFELKLIDFACNRPDRFASVDDAIKGFRESRASSRWVPQAQEDMGRAVVRPDPAGNGYVLACRRELEGAIYLAALTLDLWPPASAFQGPTLLVGADPEQKGNPPTGIANRTLATEQGYEYEMIAQAGHLLQIEKPEECREVMLRFLAKHGIV